MSVTRIEVPKREPQASWLELSHRKRQQRLQKGHDTLNAGGSIGLRTRSTQPLLELVNELGQPAHAFPEIAVRAGQADPDGSGGDLPKSGPWGH